MDPTRPVRQALFGLTLVLLATGVVMIYSASAIYADQHYGDHLYFLKRHLISVALGMGAAMIVMSIDYRALRPYSRPILIVAGLSLVAVLLSPLARTAGGARRWFPILGFHIQPSEFAKIALVMFLADRIALAERLEDFKKTLLPLLVVTGLLSGLVLLQPDLGTCAVLGAVFLLLLYAGGLRIQYFLWLFAAAALGFVTAVLPVAYRMKRVLSFLRPWEDIQGAGFQLWQSFLALGSGGFFGAGLGQSRQKLFYLPAAHTDFIFSIIGEELGFLGAGFVVAAFAALVFFGFLVVLRCPNRYGQLFGLGIVGLLAMEAIINIGVSIGAFPTKGLALPFVSYGGSAIIAKMICVGLLLNISRDARPARTP